MFKFAEVGGAVRDHFLGIEAKDVDFVAIPDSSLLGLSITEVFYSLVSELRDQGFMIFLETPEYLTVRARVPQGHPLSNRTTVADFVLARRDGPSSDGRRPDYVTPGTLYDDLARRDFTVGAMAILDGELIDPHAGMVDLQNKILRFVGDPEKRINEDGLRVLRFFSFLLTKNFEPDLASLDACFTEQSSEMVNKISLERIHGELYKMFKFDTIGSIKLISRLPDHLISAVFRGNLHLIPTLEKK